MAEPHELEERVARAISEAEGIPFSVTPTNPRHIVLMRQARAVLALVKAEQEASGNGTHQAIEWRASIRAWWLSHTAPQEK